MKKLQLLLCLLLCMMAMRVMPVQAAAYEYSAKKKAPVYHIVPKKKKKAKVLGYIKKGAVYNITKVNSTYGKITYQGKTGYVKYSYFKRYYRTGTYRLNAKTTIRKKASAKAKKIAVLAKNTQVHVTAVSGSYGKMTYKGQSAYIPLAKLTYVGKASASTSTESSTIVHEAGKKLIVIDPGHQRIGDAAQEQAGPYDPTITNNRQKTGATGVKTRQLESALNLTVSLKTKKALETLGYQVILTRTQQNVNMSNLERVAIANDNHADAYVRIHADSSTDQTAQGMHTIAPAGKSGNTYQVGDLNKASYRLAECVLEGAVKATGAKRRSISSHDKWTGHNWSQVPVTLIEIGFLSHPEEDALLSQEAYQDRVAEGIAAGIDLFFR